MTSPRPYDGVGYYPPSFSSGTPIYDSLVAERGVPQIAPINVPAALPPAPMASPSYGAAMESTSLLPALPPARLALGPGPSGGYQSAPPMTGYGAQPYVPAPRMPGQPVAGYPQPAAAQPWDQQAAPMRPNPVGPAPMAPMAPVRPLPPQQFFQQHAPQQGAPQQQYQPQQGTQQQYQQQQFGQGQFGQQQQQPYPGQVY
ncbi:hypothetical protein C7C46_10640 [Streptomyces tateyamensis]|uniref:Uncharacterized protein n=1 Tax=Streptomyces tateyamensis TaxID=565073 RepID=A0A2V4NZ53_9ACTN|nr:DUF6643 family protein [Streptomyces tateyamensis]PYC82164.1 hypothetical protein C7C46_10640 [Streptomyces tateyamensis]